MGRIQSSTGLVSGIPIVDTVDKLMAFAARPRDILQARTEQLKNEQVAVTEMTALIIGVELAVTRLSNGNLFDEREVTSSDPSLLSVEKTGSPALGTHLLTPIRQAQYHQLISSGFADPTAALGGGTFTLRRGGFVDRSIALEHLNGGAGVQRGQFRITDRSGSSQVIDLRFAQTIDDVLTAINQATQINVTAVAEGDHIRLVDNTGQAVANLRVDEVGLGTTAADLGLAGIDVAASEAAGQDVLRLYDDLVLSELNDGHGVAFLQGTADLEVTFRDGSAPLQIDFLAPNKGETQATATTDAANGLDAQIQFTSTGVGETYDGYEFTFVDDPDVTAGNETVSVNSLTKRITIRIDEGVTRAYNVIDAFNNDATASQLFTAAAAPGGNASGLIDAGDSATSSGGAVAYNNETTIGDMLATLNAADPTRLQARISASGDSIELVDLTSGAGTFSVSSLFGGTTAEDLGLTTAASGGVITGKRRLAGLQTVLLDSLGGGDGLGTLGLLDLTDRNGINASVDLSSATTLNDVVQVINSAAVGIVASVNASRNGIVLTDTTGGSGNLIVANGDATQTADTLGLAINDAVSTVDSGSLAMQSIHEATRLDSLRDGEGITLGSILVKDSQGNTGGLNLTLIDAQTVGDVIQGINGLGIGVTARINDTGDGILIQDTAGGPGKLTISDVGTGTAAAELNIAGESQTVDIGGTPTQVIDGTTALRVTLDANESLQDLVQKINDQEAGVTASLLNTGSGTAPYRLMLTSQISGSAGEMLVDGSALNLDFQEIAPAQDALVLLGDPNIPFANALATSSTNTFDDLIDGVSVTVEGTSNEPVAIMVSETNSPALDQIDLFVSQYNKLRDKLDEYTFFDEEQLTTGILFGTTVALRIDMDLSGLLSSRINGAGDIHSLAEVGLSLDDKGKLSFDKKKFLEKYNEDPEAVRTFFTQAETGLADRMKDLAERLAGEDNSMLLSRIEAIQKTVENNERRIAHLEEILDRQRERMLKSFYRLEEVIGKMQLQLTALSQLQVIPPLTSTRNSN